MRAILQIFSTNRFKIRLENSNENIIKIFHSEYRWRKLSKWFKTTRQTECQMCRIKKKLEVHHILPWHKYPNLRFEVTNLITLCRECHYRFGHWRNWKDQNDHVRELTFFTSCLNPDIVIQPECLKHLLALYNNLQNTGKKGHIHE